MTDIVERLREQPTMSVFANIGDMLGRLNHEREEAAAEIERLRETLRLGVEARQAQRTYFKDRTQSNLVASKVAEKAFDDAARTALGEDK